MEALSCRSLPQQVVVLLAIVAAATCQLVAAAPDPVDPNVCSWTRHGSPYPLSTSFPTCPLPLDSRFFTGTADAVSYAPWSAPPICPDLKPSSAPLNRHKPSYKPCLYQSATFRNGAGLALLTMPKLAASVAGSALDDSLVPLHVRSHPSSSMNSEYANVMYVSYDVVDVAGKGKGVVARRRIAPWDTVLVDSAVLVVPGDFGGSGGKDARRMAGAMVRRMVDGLPPQQRREVEREIAGVRAAETEDEGNDKLLNVLRTHAFGVEIEEVLHTAVFPLASRVNHDCKPNTLWRFSPRTLGMELIALRTIDPGEEITHSYAPLSATSKHRAEILSHWGINCTCTLCAGPKKETFMSDTRRERLYEIHNALAQEHLTKAEISGHVRELSVIVDIERLQPQWVTYHELIARAYLRSGFLNSAARHAQKAEEEWARYGGADHEYQDGLRALWADVREGRLKEDRRKALEEKRKLRRKALENKAR